MTDPTPAAPPAPTLAQDLAAAAPELDALSAAIAASMGAPATIVELIQNLLPFVQTAVANRSGMSVTDATAAQAHLQGTMAKLQTHIDTMQAAPAA